MFLQTVLTWRLDYVAFCIVVLAVHVVTARWLRRHRQINGLGMAFWVFLIGMLAVGFAPVEFFGEREMDRRRDMLMGIAPTYAREMEFLGHSKLPSDAAPDDPLYLSLIRSEVRWLKANPNVSDIYTFRKRGDKVVLIVDSETDYNHDGAYDAPREMRTPIGKEYPEVTEGILAAFKGEPSFDSELYTDEWGTWVSALEPMYDADGKVEAVLGVDYPAAAWITASFVARLCAMGGILLITTIVTSATMVLRTQKAALAARLVIEAQLREARDAAEASNIAKSSFLANMSHEIRTPMTAILGYLDLVADADIREDQRAEHIRTIRRNGDHLLTIINDVLDLSKIEAGRLELESVGCSPMQIVAEVESLLRVRSAARKIGLEVIPVYPIPSRIQTDPHRLRQVLLNLVGNAIKFTERGAVTIRVSLDGPDGPLAFAITDSGIGMSPDTLATLFQPFSQGDASMSRRFGGTGLGLTISKRLAEHLGGGITVASEPGRGSTFTVTIPTGPLAGVEMLTRDTAVARPVVNASPTGAVRINARILLAEDGPDNQRLFSHHLRHAGARLQIVDNGQAALDALASSPPFDLVLMDMQMPGMDGYTATAMARARGVTIPIIALTANAMSGDRERCMACGCSDYLSKPIDKTVLLQTCDKWAKSASAAA